MFTRTKIILALGASAVGLGSYALVQKSHVVMPTVPASLKQQNVQLVPDEETRREAEKIRPQDIAFLQLYGSDVGTNFYEPDPTQNITDPRLILGFLDALRNAESLPNSGNETYTNSESARFSVHFKPGRGQEIRFALPTLAFPSGCMGQAFQNMVRELARYRAEQLRTLMRKRGKRLVKVEGPFFDLRSVRELQGCVRQFSHVTEAAFDYTHAEYLISIEFKFDDKSHQTVYFVLPPRPKNPAGRKVIPPWPPLLEKELQETIKRMREIYKQ